PPVWPGSVSSSYSIPTPSATSPPAKTPPPCGYHNYRWPSVRSSSSLPCWTKPFVVCAAIPTKQHRKPRCMNEILVITMLVVSIVGFLACGVWVGLTLAGAAWLGMEIFSARSAGDAMAITIWGAASSWTLTALPLFLWMGEILFRTRLSQDLFSG